MCFGLVSKCLEASALWRCSAHESSCNVEQLEGCLGLLKESQRLTRSELEELEALKVELLQQQVRRQLAAVPASEQFSLPMARAFAALSQAAFCRLAHISILGLEMA